MSRVETRRRAEKGDLQTFATSGEFAATCGVTPRTFRRWQQSGRVPEPAARTPKGWALWSPEQVTEVLRSL